MIIFDVFKASFASFKCLPINLFNCLTINSFNCLTITNRIRVSRKLVVRCKQDAEKICSVDLNDITPTEDSHLISCLYRNRPKVFCCYIILFFVIFLNLCIF